MHPPGLDRVNVVTLGVVAEYPKPVAYVFKTQSGTDLIAIVSFCGGRRAGVPGNKPSEVAGAYIDLCANLTLCH